jgi:phosphopantetheinyl transferase (holo-ACP synthase)
MSQITLRGMDEEVEKRIRRIARQKGQSLNRVILEMIYQQSGPKKKSEEPQAKSLRRLAGGWTRKEADQFLKSIESCEQIDEAVWK